MNVVVFTGFCGCGGVEPFFLVFGGVSLLQAFAQSFACETKEISGISMVPSPLPNPYSLKQLRVHNTIFTCAPRGWYCTFGNLPHSIDATGVHQQVSPFLFLGDAEDALTMIASFMKQTVFRGQFRVAWGTVCYQDAFAPTFVGRLHTLQSTSGTNARGTLRWRLSRLGSCCDSQVINIIYI